MESWEVCQSASQLFWNSWVSPDQQGPIRQGFPSGSHLPLSEVLADRSQDFHAGLENLHGYLLLLSAWLWLDPGAWETSRWVSELEGLN